MRLKDSEFSNIQLDRVMISYISMTLFTPDLKIMRATVPSVTKLLSVYVVYNSTWRVTLTKQLSLHFHMLKYFVTTIAFTLHWVSNVAISRISFHIF